MTALVVIAVIAAVFAAIGFIRLGVGVKYDDEGFAAWIKIAFKTITLFPRPERAERPAKAKEKPPKEKPEKVDKEEKPKKKFDFLDMFGGIRGLLSLVRDVLSDFFSLVYTDRLVIKFVSAKKDDPATAAENYGYACMAAGVISPLLENNRNVSYYSIKLGMDYEAEKSDVAGELKISVSIGRVVRFALKYGVKVLVLFLKYKRKGGKEDGKASIQYA